MARKLPPFAALRAFEALARRRTLQDAADELLISSSAVSHQVKSLETFLSAKLVTRTASGLILTPIGRKFVDGLGDALDRIEAATLAVLSTRQHGVLKIHLFQSLAQSWLIPQLADFMSTNPDISIRTHTMQDDVDLSGTDIDLAIAFFDGKPDNPNATEKLIDEKIFPVCSPKFIETHGAITSPTDILRHKLIACSYTPDEWRIWLEAVGVDASNIGPPQLMFDKRSHVLQAADEGLGIAMERTPFSSVMIKRGQLIPAVDIRIATGAGYYLVAPPRSLVLTHVKQFRAWLRTICADEGAVSPK
ncbi:LysR substrate-binding domain-containing protein [Aminobacter carboxidus]|uniref:LysR family transcriptional regulator n=1 Tax=Aminobacter carboxidus TaxID=376165 RepID=A0ABR9GRI8_9HYPH|nr:LysR substrate-binding domain-containing protein [Aminobacter carboxidus]MBE1206276.1 LysR family transcriptional regulator [Aminobacter carboxidus]